MRAGSLPCPRIIAAITWKSVGLQWGYCEGFSLWGCSGVTARGLVCGVALWAAGYGSCPCDAGIS